MWSNVFYFEDTWCNIYWLMCIVKNPGLLKTPGPVFCMFIKKIIISRYQVRYVAPLHSCAIFCIFLFSEKDKWLLMIILQAIKGLFVCVVIVGPVYLVCLSCFFFRYTNNIIYNVVFQLMMLFNICFWKGEWNLCYFYKLPIYIK